MKKAVIYIYDQIGGGITADDFRRTLQDMEEQGAEEFEVHLNSPGGSVFDGLAIYNLLKERNVTIVIDALAASIASVIAMAGKRVLIYKNSFVMIHNPWTVGVGDSNELKKQGQNLDLFRESIIKAYKDKTGLSDADIKNYMDSEKWFTADEAVNLGFCDEIADQEAKAYIGFYYNLLNGDDRMNAKLLAFFGLKENATDAEIEAKLNELRTKFALKPDACIDDIVIAMADSAKPVQAPAAEAVSKPAASEAEALQTRIAQLEKRINDKDAADSDAKAEALVNASIESGKILPAEKDVYLNSARADFDKTKAALDGKKTGTAMPGSMNMDKGQPAKKVEIADAAAFFKAAGRK